MSRISNLERWSRVLRRNVDLLEEALPGDYTYRADAAYDGGGYESFLSDCSLVWRPEDPDVGHIRMQGESRSQGRDVMRIGDAMAALASGVGGSRGRGHGTGKP